MRAHAYQKGISNHSVVSKTYINEFYRDSDIAWRSDSKNINKIVRIENTKAHQVLVSVGPSVFKTLSEAPQNLVYVTQENCAETLGGTIDSTTEYFITGVLDVSGVQINVPPTGMYIQGYNFNLSQLVSSDDNATLFYSLNSGNFLMKDIGIEMSGTNSQVYDLKAATGFEAIEVERINYNNCTSLGTMDNFRQGLETGTGRFGGTPELTLTGVWLGGFILLTTIVRSLDDGAYSLFKAGVGFSMASRFKTDMNVDLPASVSFLDFAPSNFPNPGTVQLNGMIITRNGVLAPADANITPNISHADLSSAWSDNQGIRNTHVGGLIEVTSEVETVVTVQGDLYDLSGPVWTADNLEHFDEPSNGQLRHLGQSPIEYRVSLDLSIEGTANSEARIEIWKYDDSATSAAMVYSTSRQINSLVGGRDVAHVSAVLFVDLELNDYLYLRIANDTGTDNFTIENTSTLLIEAR